VRRDLPIEQLVSFLERPNVAVLATFRPDGGVLLSPVWYEWRDGGFNIGTGEDDLKVRHLTRDPRATVVVAEQAPPYAGVEVRGTARLIHEGAREIARRIAARYTEGSGGEDSVVIRLEPGALRTWDFADDYGS
jgi:PPOX class probable F420-dependent enzyme